MNKFIKHLLIALFAGCLATSAMAASHSSMHMHKKKGYCHMVKKCKKGKCKNKRVCKKVKMHKKKK